MSIRLNDTAPDFVAESVLPNGTGALAKGTVHFHQWLDNSWAILFSHPADFTPVCTTELGAVAKLCDEFKKRNIKVIALSVDEVSTHLEWIKDINETQNTFVNFPIIADPEFKVSHLYGFVHPNASDKFTVRSVVIIAPDKKVKLLITYPASTGRNFEEILRVVDSLQLTANYDVATPANWKHGEDVVVVPAIKTEDIQAKFPKGFKIIKPYLRTTPQPNI